MSTQIQCPNCSGYRVNVQNQKVITTEEQKKYTNPVSGFFWLGVIILGFSILAALSFGVVFGAGLAIILLLLSVFGRYRAVKKGTADWYMEKVPSVIKYDYRCEICGFNWTWQSDEPLPEVHIRPGLIAKGAQKLKEEDEARRQAEIAHHVAQDILNRKP